MVTMAKIPADAALIRKQLIELESLEQEATTPGNKEALASHRGKLLRKLNSMTRQEREGLEAKIGADLEDMRVRVLPTEDYDRVLRGRTTDPRAAQIMEAATQAGIELEPGETVVIKSVSGIDVSVSEKLTKQFQKDLSRLGDGFVVLASRGSVGAGGIRGDLSGLEVGTVLQKTFKGQTVTCEITEVNGEKVIVGVAGKGHDGSDLKNQEFHSLSGAAQKVTGYNTRGTIFWNQSNGNGKN